MPPKVEQIVNCGVHTQNAGEYGYCHICGDEIGVARLGFDPASTRCIGCMDN